MRRLTGSLRAYAELARISNLPTCISNSLVGCALGAGGGVFPWMQIAPVAGGICSLYIAGMVLNDLFDRRQDALERPERPIPSGRVSVAAAGVFAAAATLLGLGLLAVTTRRALEFGLLLVLAIVLYDLMHKRHPATVLLMGACRGLVYLVAAAGISASFDLRTGLWLATTLGLYTVAITVVARSENLGRLDARRWLAVAMPPAILAAGLVGKPASGPAVLLTAVLLVFWLARAARQVLTTPPNTRAAIQLWISGMCLIDAFFLTLLEQPAAALAALLCFVITVYSHRRIAGT